MLKNRGFTLIELLMTITIMGILASVILPRLNTAREHGADALVKTNMSSVSAQAEIVHDSVGNFATVCTDATLARSLDVASEKSTGSDANDVCYNTASAWAAAVPLRRQNLVSDTSGEDYWCVDNSGQAELIDDQLAADTTTCP